MLTIGGSDALFAFLISNNNFKVLWYFSSGDSSGATFILYGSMLHASSLAKGYDSGPPSLHPWQI